MDEAKTRDAIWRTVQALNHAWALDGDADRLADYFHEDMVAITPSDRQRLEGREACMASWKKFVESAKVTRWEERDPQVQLFGAGKLAVVTYYYDMSVDMGGGSVELAGRDMMVLVEEDGRWLVVADQFSGFPGEPG
jgi:uncharacterized protein (TIGR02246 family)